MKLTIVSTTYCTKDRPVLVFLDHVVQEMVDLGIECTVITPQSLHSFLFRSKEARSFISKRKTARGNPYCVYSPLFLIFPIRTILGVQLADFSQRSFYKALKRICHRLELQSHAIYAHFFQAGISAVWYAEHLGVPVFIANGESDTFAATKRYSPNLMQETLAHVTGIISVSSKNREEVAQICCNDPAIMRKVTVIPNAVNTDRFAPKDRVTCRERLSFPQDVFIVMCTGHFIERKGVLRLAHALDRIGDVRSIFIGSGPEPPEGEHILFRGCVNNNVLSDYLCAADVFVLPTLAEGCCNAIVEAMACGLPIISSDLSFNHDILDASNAILIDPMDEEAIAQAICTLRDNPQLARELGNASLEKAKGLTIGQRVETILSFIRSKSEGTL